MTGRYRRGWKVDGLRAQIWYDIWNLLCIILNFSGLEGVRPPGFRSCRQGSIIMVPYVALNLVQR